MAGKKPDALTRIKSGVFSRGMALAKVSMTAGMKAAGHAMGSILADSDGKAERLRSMLVSQAELLARELGQLKGTAMKVGQQLSIMGEYFLPPEVNQVLKSLQSDSPPLAWPEMEKVLKRQLSAESLAKLEVDPEPMASASLGQVHLATVKATGERLALKIQYPGVDRAIEGDLKAMRSVLSLARMIPTGARTDELFDEVKGMLRQEVDYRRELAFTDEFARHYAGQDGVIVPRAVAEFSTARVLATSFEEGLRPDDPEVAALSQERRDAIALVFLEAYFRELFEFGLMQTDPHLGNYRIRLGDGTPGNPDRLVLLDFGAARRYSRRFLKPYYSMIDGLIHGDRERFFSAGREMGFLIESDSEELHAVFHDLCAAIMEPFALPGTAGVPAEALDAEGRYAWGAGDLPKRCAALGSRMILQFRLRTPPREVVFLDRKMAGVYIFLSVMKARLRSRELLERYLATGMERMARPAAGPEDTAET
ncbi:MAG: AarF/ABC1/UbiB kinase family protein [Bdellovibrionales bacterium]|nr:AarF/ABC1/UbiB kinase family protein [Bdellovibrionales bacterium]